VSIKGKLSVHVVDDEPVIAWTLAAILESNGFTAIPFTNPHQSLEAASTAAPNLLISDVAMPGMTGVELAIRMKEFCPQCKVILFSGQAATANLLADAAVEGHAFEILRKPLHPSELLALVKSVTIREGHPSQN
jgi:DNA-binding NtrC family response regulator